METPTPTPGEIARCEAETWKHIHEVQKAANLFCMALITRATYHDQSKFSDAELPYFAVATPRLRGVTYGSEEYRANLRAIKPAIDHHQKVNDHHPEYHENGIDGMTLVSLVEMFCDWVAASMRHADGDIMKSIDINEKRFNMSPQLASIFRNTAKVYRKDSESRPTNT